MPLLRLSPLLATLLILAPAAFRAAAQEPDAPAAPPPAATNRPVQAPVTNILVTVDPPAAGKQVVTINVTPTASFTAELIEVECRYRQEFAWPPKAANPGTRVIEPAIFTYRTRGVKFVDALDLHISFFVPVDVKELREKHGPTTFVAHAPVTVSSVTVTAFEGERKTWSFQARPALVARDGVLH